MGYEIIIWNVIASSKDNMNGEYPTHGTYEQRQAVTKMFNDFLSIVCCENKLIYLSIFNEIIDAKGYPKNDYYMDSVHLSQKAMPIVIQKVKVLMPDLSPILKSENNLPVKSHSFVVRQIHRFKRLAILQYYISRSYITELCK